MKVNCPGVELTDEQRKTFRESVYGKPGAATRNEVRQFMVESLKNAFSTHSIAVTVATATEAAPAEEE